MKEKIESEVNEIDNIENNEKSLETKSRKKSKVVIALLIALILGLVLIFSFSSYKILFSPKKAKFLTYLSSDIYEIKNMTKRIGDNNFVKLITKSNKEIDFNISSSNKQLLGNAIINKDFLALKIKDVNENYLLLENKNLEQFWEKLGLKEYDLPSEIDFTKSPLEFNQWEQLKIVNYISKVLANIIENLEVEKFIENYKKEIIINNETKEIPTLEVQLSETDLFMLQKEALMLLEDEGILNLIVKKFDKLGLADGIDKDSIKSEIKKYIAYLDYATAYYNLQNDENDYKIIYRMYLENNEVIAREIVEKYKYENTMYEDIILRVINSNDGFYEIKSFTQDDYNSAYYNIISDTVTENGDVKTHSLTYAIEGFFVGYEEGENYQYIPVNSEKKYKIQISNAESGTKIITFNEENSEIECNVSYTTDGANIVFTNNDFSLEVKIKKSDMTQQTLLEQNAAILNEKAPQQLIYEFSKIGTSFSELSSVSEEID